MKNIILYILLFMPVVSFSQAYQLMPDFYRPIDSAAIAENRNEEKKSDFGVTVGTGFSSFGRGSGMMQSYVAPHFDFQVNEKLSLNFTGVIMNSNGSFFNNSPGMMSQTSGTNAYAISGGTTYQPKDNLFIRAEGTFMENSVSPYNPFPMQQNSNYKSFSFGMGYKFNEKTQIGFEFRISDGYNPYYSPYRNMYNTSPFDYQSPFYW